MIKKYTKKDATKETIWASQVVEDLRSIEEQQTSLHDIRRKVLSRINKEVDDDYVEGSRDWAHVLSMLPIENY